MSDPSDHKSTATTPSLAETAPWEQQERNALRCYRGPPQILACPKALPHKPPLVVLVHSDTLEHGYLWVRHPEACKIHASLGLLSSHHKIAAITCSEWKAPCAHPTPSKHKPRLPCSPSSHTLCLSPCTVIFGLYQAQGSQTPAKTSLF